MIRHSLSLVLAILFGFTATLNAEEMQLAHMVYFTLTDDTPENRKQLVTACETHLSQREDTVYFSVGSIADDLRRDVNDRDFSVALHMVFANKQAHDNYQSHPMHLKFIEENKHLWSQVRVFDSYVPTATSVAGMKKPLTTMDELLAAKITVEFDQLSMEMAFAETGKRITGPYKISIPFRITVVGKDLQLEGITRNQLIRKFSHRNQSLADVLTALVMHANPVTSVKSPSDPRQRLVWVVSADRKSILITTRSAVQTSGEKLPGVFRSR